MQMHVRQLGVGIDAAAAKREGATYRLASQNVATLEATKASLFQLVIAMCITNECSSLSSISKLASVN